MQIAGEKIHKLFQVMIKFGKNLWYLLYFRCCILYGEASNNCKLIIILLSDTFLCINSTDTDFDSIIFVRYNLKGSQRSHILIVNTWEWFIYGIWVTFMMMNLHTKFKKPSSTNSYLIAIGPEARRRFRVAAMLLV
jgi:hypothetical protein